MITPLKKFTWHSGNIVEQEYGQKDMQLTLQSSLQYSHYTLLLPFNNHSGPNACFSYPERVHYIISFLSTDNFTVKMSFDMVATLLLCAFVYVEVKL